MRVNVVEDTTEGARCDQGFVRVRRRRLSVTFADGTTSAPFPYDEAWRENLDAVTIAAHYRDAGGVPYVYLRSAMRPPLALRPPEPVAAVQTDAPGGIWELPAGLVERDERTAEGLLRCAAREVEEELGFRVDAARYAPLGRGMFPTPGLIAERIHFFHVEVDPAARAVPSEDGSVLERDAVIVALSLEHAMTLVRAGKIEDMKTEIGLRRLDDHYRP